MPELALQTALLRPALQRSLHRSGTCVRMNHAVDHVVRTSAGFRVEGRLGDGTPWQTEGDIVVNCLWNGRLQIDATLGISPIRPWVHRLKYSALGQLPTHLRHFPSHTLVLGPFGDLVTYPSDLAYLSWYPVSIRGWSATLQPPAAWDAPCRGRTAVADATWLPDALAAFDEIFPGAGRFQAEHVNTGIIVSWGETDIDDPASQLHHRHEVGVNAYDGYFSIDTGKFITAPLFAQALLQQLQPCHPA